MARLTLWRLNSSSSPVTSSLHRNHLLSAAYLELNRLCSILMSLTQSPPRHNRTACPVAYVLTYAVGLLFLRTSTLPLSLSIISTWSLPAQYPHPPLGLAVLIQGPSRSKNLPLQGRNFQTPTWERKTSEGCGEDS